MNPTHFNMGGIFFYVNRMKKTQVIPAVDKNTLVS